MATPNPLPFQYGARWSMFADQLDEGMRRVLEDRDRQLEDYLGKRYAALTGRLLPVSFQSDGGSTLGLTTSYVAMTGLSISVPVLTGDIIEANLIADLRVMTGANVQTNALPEAKLAVDGVTQAQSAFIWLDRVEINSTMAFIVSQNYRLVAAANTTHTLTVHAKYGGTALVAGASAAMDGAHTNLAVKVYRQYG